MFKKLLIVSLLVAGTVSAMQQPALTCAEKCKLTLRSRRGFDCYMCTGVAGESAIAGTGFYCAHYLASSGTVCAAGPCAAGVCALGWIFYIAHSWHARREHVPTYQELVQARYGAPAEQEMV